MAFFLFLRFSYSIKGFILFSTGLSKAITPPAMIVIYTIIRGLLTSLGTKYDAIIMIVDDIVRHTA